MTSLYSQISSSDQEGRFNQQSFKIQQKNIAKQKSKHIKSSEVHFNQLVKRDFIYQITTLESTRKSNQNYRYQCQQLGALFIDKFLIQGNFFERSYKQESVEFKYSFFSQNTQILGKNILECDETIQFYKLLPCEIISDNYRKTFEDNITKPYECLNLFFFEEKLVGLNKKMNFDLLRMMGINEDILEDYLQKENSLPIFWDISQFIKLKEGIYYNTNLINFQGEIFFSQIEIKKFIQLNPCQKISNQYIYFIYNCNRIQLNVCQIEKNFLNYFSLQSLPLSQQMSIHKSRINKPCQIKPIIDLK